MTLATKLATMTALRTDRTILLKWYAESSDFASLNFLSLQLRRNLDATYEIYAMATSEEKREENSF